MGDIHGLDWHHRVLRESLSYSYVSMQFQFLELLVSVSLQFCWEQYWKVNRNHLRYSVHSVGNRNHMRLGYDLV